ncbi:MAG: undecaprenyldiphospho-muramoylpentapeptide beta-N-acetylglucosaminyltransferase [Oscillospiraceae bacterium]|nr:undecaprenyldiphospho-muramoylpentapeptide beta-N-acetylglucosaminyltransferase [Oscillospiraceae bacterium]
MKVLFACGGTAGHINPAIAVAQRLQALDPSTEVLFVGTPDRMESELVPRAGYAFESVKVSSFSRSLSASGLKHNITAAKEALTATHAAKKIVRAFQPDIAVGTGGYVCYPVLKAAAQLNVPTLVHESNAVPGLTTKMLLPDVDRILVGFEESRQHYGDPTRVFVTGTPVRTGFSDCTKDEAKRRLGLPVDQKLVVSLWGSLGARIMNEKITDMIALAGETPGFRLIHSAGKSGYDTVAKKLQETCAFDLAASGYDVRPYIYDMPLVMAAADLVLCRAGASTLAELTYLGKPAILVPSPYVTNNHQEKNARVLEHAGGAKVLLEPELTGGDLLAAIRTLLADPAALETMAENMKSCGVPDATERIADIVLEMVRLYQ